MQRREQAEQRLRERRAAKNEKVNKWRQESHEVKRLAQEEPLFMKIQASHQSSLQQADM